MFWWLSPFQLLIPASPFRPCPLFHSSFICFFVTNRLGNGCVREHVPSCTWIREEVGWGEINCSWESFSLICNVFYKHNRKKEAKIYMHFYFRFFFFKGNVKGRNAIDVTDNSSWTAFYSGWRKGTTMVEKEKKYMLLVLPKYFNVMIKSD